MWIPPRDSRFQYELNMGMGKIDAVFNKDPLDLDVKVRGGGEIMFVFPERWLSTQEEQLFVSKLWANPQIKNAKLTIIDIVTKSPLIVGNFIKEDVRIVKPVEGSE